VPQAWKSRQRVDTEWNGKTMANWARLYENILDGDNMMTAFEQSEYVCPALLWVITRAASAESDTFNASRSRLRSAARRFCLTEDKLESGFAALASIGFIERDGDMVTIQNWRKFQSDYLVKKQRKKEAEKSAPPSGLKAPTKPVVSGEDQPPTERDAGREPPALDDLKQPGPEGIKTKAKSKTKALPEEATEIVALWKAFLSRHKAALSRTDASFAQGAKNLVKCHSEAGIEWATLKRCAERYLAEVESDRRFGFVYSFGNFYGRDAHYEAYLADDWTVPAPQKSVGQIHEIPSISAKWEKEEPDDNSDFEELLADMKARKAENDGFNY